MYKSQSNYIPSMAEQAKIDKEKLLQKKEEKPLIESIGPNFQECGIKNPCKFGKHNLDFNKQTVISNNDNIR